MRHIRTSPVPSPVSVWRTRDTGKSRLGTERGTRTSTPVPGARVVPSKGTALQAEVGPGLLPDLVGRAGTCKGRQTCSIPAATNGTQDESMGLAAQEE